MGKKEKKAQHNAAHSGEQSTESGHTQEPAMKKKKKSKGEPKAGREEESHTCCWCRFPLLCALLQLAFGVAVTVLGFLMAGVSSSLPVRDTPYWAGIIVSIKPVCA